MPDPQDLPLPDPVIEEIEEDPTLDDWTPDFPIIRAGHERIDSRRWLVLPERYTFKPLRAMAAAREADALAAAPHGRALVALASRLLAQRRGYVELLRGAAELDLDEDGLQEQVDLRMRDHAQLALEEFVGEARIEPYAWAERWLVRCEAFRVTLPSRRDGERRDPGGLVATCKGAGEWTTYYAGRQTTILRLAAACAWGSLGPFLVDLS